MSILISQQNLLESVFIWGIIQKELMINVTVPVNAQSKAWVYGSTVAGIAGTSPSGAWMSVYCECCVLSVRSPCVELITLPEGSTNCCVFEYDRGASKTRRSWPIRGCCAIKKYYKYI
jgi:hypothetical protein